ncbi:MAG: chemotaxis protein CheA [Cyclobacteriaceae bacterium]|nr:chemotaxis protein CheA [Cyclobacteriaceae bacterium]
MDNMKAVYLEEANELLNNLENALLQLDETPEEKSLIEEVFRIMHTLKGNSSMFGFANIAEFIHNLETVYDHIRGGKQQVTKELIDTTLASMDHIKQIVDDHELSDSSNKDRHESLTIQILSFTGEAAPTQIKAEPREVKEVVAPESAEKTYHIHFKPGKSVVKDGNNPLYLIDELFTLGECRALPYTERVEDINKFDPKDCITGWSIFLATEKAENDIKDVFVFVETGSEIKVEKLSDNNLFKNGSFKENLSSMVLENAPVDISVLQIVEEAPVSSSGITKTAEAPEPQKVDKPKETRAATPAAKEKAVTSIRVQSEKLDELMNLVSELITTQAALSLYTDKQSNSELESISENVEKLSRQLRDIAFGMTLIPINNMFGRFQRMVRDISKELGKEVAFITEGGETELDKSIIESLTDPLMHILRNSLDHGIESKEERQALGKPERGTIVLRAYYSGTNVNVEIRDDGKGINPDVIREKAIEKGVIQEDSVLSKKEIFNLIFHAGFSTAKVITDVSGRGVGMDVVRRNINNLRGEIDIESEVNEGTTLTISLPLSLSIIDGLLIELGKGYFVVPLAAIDKCYTHADAKEVNKFTNIMELDNEQIPYIDLREIFHVKDELKQDITRQIVVVNNGKGRVGLICDHIIGEYQAVIKPLGVYFKEQDHISGSTILGDGTVALVFDTNRLVKKYVTKHEDIKLS